MDKKYFFLFFLLLIPFVSSAITFESDIPDICIKYNTSQFDINLSEYYDLSSMNSAEDKVWVVYENPVTSNPAWVAQSYFTYHGDYYEMEVFGYLYGYPDNPGIRFFNKDPFDWETSYNSDYYGYNVARVRICENSGSPYSSLCSSSVGINSNYFSVNVSEACPNGGYSSGGGGGNSTYNLTNNLIASYSLNETGASAFGDKSSLLQHATATNGNKGLPGATVNTNNSWNVSGSGYASSGVSAYSGGSSFTSSMWIKPYATSSGTEFIGAINANNLPKPFTWYRPTTNNDTLYWSVGDGSSGSDLQMEGALTIGQWYFITGTYNGSHQFLYINGVLNSSKVVSQSISWASSVLTIGTRADHYLPFRGLIDEFNAWNRTLNSSEVLALYQNHGIPFNVSAGGGGGGTYVPPVQNSSFPDQYLNGSSHKWVNISDYFWNYTAVILYAPDPISSNVVPLSNFGYAGTLWGDYYEAQVNDDFPNTMDIYLESYQRPYNVSFTLYVCNKDEVNASLCVSDNFTLFISANLSGVLDLDTWFSPINLTSNYSDNFWYSLNSYYQYYDNFTIYFADSNSTGILNSSHNYRDNTSITFNNVSKEVILNCSLGDDEVITFLGDINVTLECLDYNIYLYLAYNNADYYQNLFVQACNSVNCSTLDFFSVLAGNPDYFTGSSSPVRFYDVINTSITDIGVNYSSIYDAIPLSDNQSINHMYALISLSAIFFSSFIFFVLVFRLGKMGVYITFILTWCGLFFFANGGFISWIYVVVPPTLLILFFFGKLLLGGSS